MGWADFVNLICDTEPSTGPSDWHGPGDRTEEENLRLYKASRRRLIDPFRLFTHGDNYLGG